MSDCRFGVSPVNYPDPDIIICFGQDQDQDQDSYFIPFLEWGSVPFVLSHDHS